MNTECCAGAYAAAATPIWWPEKQPGATLTQAFDTTVLPDPIYPSQIQSLAAQIAPSGTGEMQAEYLGLEGSLVTLLETSGQPGRIYQILFTATLVDNETVQWVIHQAVACAFPPQMIPPPPSPGFGTEIQWMPIPAVASGLIATGTTPQTAVSLGALTNVFSTVLPGAYAILPTFVVNGTIKVINEGANQLLLLPPLGAQIGSAGANAPVAVASGGWASFSTSAPLAQWSIS